jgi:small ligand-binding sensory domain FIST
MKKRDATVPQFTMAHLAANDDSGADWEPLAANCLRQLGEAAATATLGFVYASGTLGGHLGALTAYLRDSTGIRDWVGGAGLGICAGAAEYFDRPALALMVADMPRDHYRLLPTVTSAEDLGDMPGWIASRDPAVAVVHADPRHPNLTNLIEGVAQGLPAFLVGGLASARSDRGRTPGGIGGVVFGNGVAVATGLSQGCSSIGGLHRVGEATRNIVQDLDGRPALDVLRDDLNRLPQPQREDTAAHLHVALPVPGSDTGDYVVRNLMGVDPRSGALAIGDRVSAGDTLMFCRRDRAAAEEDLERMLGRLKRRLSAPPRAGLYFTCIARGPNLFGPNAEEMAIVRRALGDFPLVGMFCDGEISNNRLYGYTGVLTLFL